MGRRGRLRGVTEAAVRAARRATEEKDARGHEIAQAVYLEVRNWADVDGPDFMAPVAVAAQMAAPGVAEIIGGDATPDEVAVYLSQMFYGLCLGASAERLKVWRESQHVPEPAPLA